MFILVLPGMAIFVGDKIGDFAPSILVLMSTPREHMPHAMGTTLAGFFVCKEHRNTYACNLHPFFSLEGYKKVILFYFIFLSRFDLFLYLM